MSDDLKRAAKSWRDSRRRKATELTSDEVRRVYEVAEQLSARIPMGLIHRGAIVAMLPLLLEVEKTFRIAHATQLPPGTAFDPGETTLLKRSPLDLSKAELSYIIAVTTTVRTMRQAAAHQLGIEPRVVDYLADAFPAHELHVGRALHLVERSTVEINLVIWRAFASELLTQVPAHTHELAIAYHLAPHDIRVLVLNHRTLWEERARLYAATHTNTVSTLARADGSFFGEIEVWQALLPEGAEILQIERPTAPAAPL